MHRRLWPMPPPMVSGSSSVNSILWNGSAARSLHPAMLSWRASASASTPVSYTQLDVYKRQIQPHIGRQRNEVRLELAVQMGLGIHLGRFGNVLSLIHI